MAVALNNTVLRTFECFDSTIPPKQYTQCLCNIDNDIMTLQCDHIIIISLPYKKNDIKNAMTEFNTTAFIDESMLFCFDIIIGFVIADKKTIQNKLKINQLITSSERNVNKWQMDKYEELLLTQSLIIINTKNSDYISMPRNVNQIHSKWTISWNHYDANNNMYSNINETICHKIASIYLPLHFELTEDWTKRTDFTGVLSVGYMCENGAVIQGDCLRQRGQKIFLFFPNEGRLHFGAKYDWIKVPNERLCPPPNERLLKQNKTKEPILGCYTVN